MSSQQKDFCRMNADINYKGKYYCMLQRSFHHYATGPTMTLVVTDQILGNISDIIVHKDLQTPICFEFLHMPRCNIKQISHATKLQYMHMGKSITIIPRCH